MSTLGGRESSRHGRVFVHGWGVLIVTCVSRLTHPHPPETAQGIEVEKVNINENTFLTLITSISEAAACWPQVH